MKINVSIDFDSLDELETFFNKKPDVVEETAPEWVSRMFYENNIDIRTRNWALKTIEKTYQTPPTTKYFIESLSNMNRSGKHSQNQLIAAYSGCAHEYHRAN